MSRCEAWCAGDDYGEDHTCVGDFAELELTAQPGEVSDDGVILGRLCVANRRRPNSAPLVGIGIEAAPYSADLVLTSAEARRLAAILVECAEKIDNPLF
ncbi:hypothetical protein FOS14_18780 [Skermania sp. ID1734]|uniref:DUF6907 domain-containing protein n=1 Tax=Skermania sp. ID1734 TaxID=2597516 RepID=UPI0011810E52|nr:hypothetical protein [Skermania sp. ID1734]TSD95040.1 hypothetical protein FOS14_18780 [Skermania sp. ID1734]